MVKTRKRPGVDESPENDFISLRGRNNKRGVHSESEENGEVSSAEEEVTPQSKRQRVTVRGRSSRSLGSRTPIDYPQRSRSRQLEATPIGVSSMSPRRTRSKSDGKKYTNHISYRDDAEDEDEDVLVRSPRTKRVPVRFRENENEQRGRRSQQHENEDEEEEEEEEEDEVKITPKGRRRSLQLRDLEEEENQQEVKPRGRRGGRPRKAFKEEVQVADHDLEDDENDPDYHSAPRRSNRERKMIYATMNQSLIGNCYSTDLLLSGGADVSPPVSSSRRKKKQSQPKEDDEEEEEEEKEETRSNKSDRSTLDMYSRIKNRRLSQKKGDEEQQNQEEEEEEDDSEDDSDSDDDSDDSDDDTSSEESSDEEETRKNYSLRRQRRPPDRFEATIEERIPRRALKESLFDQALSPLRRRLNAHHNNLNLTPIRSPHFSRGRSRKHVTHHSSSTSSDSDDERQFERRKKKSMAKARMRCLPMNMNQEEASSGVIRDRQRIGSSLADVDPMNIDSNVTFESVGGLGRHLQSLKEMIVFPLLYPEVFERFKITPPRGVLFHGPPGTGKTLVARALANECRQGEKRVAFFMRKGADCLSKWVGESERQLRLLFDQAFQMRPAIIFFDEIDGLAPVRSSRQDQIHSSIVSTLLALMDGLDSRGEIVVIGATNRIDSIDPALRRPGRFDREFLFPLPSASARKSILAIHTKEWNPKLSDTFVGEVAEKCVGYCGADMKALCTEAGLSALRHQYPQIYASKEKLKLDLSRIQVSARDFQHAMQTIVPAAQRAVISPGRSLSFTIKPLLQSQFISALEVIQKLIPTALYSTSKFEGPGSSDASNMVLDMLNEDDFSEEDEAAPSIFVSPATKESGHRRRILSDTDGGASSKTILNFSCAAYNKPSTYRPRLLLEGNQGQGQSSHLAPAILHHLERLPVHCLDLAALFAVSAKAPEESCAQIFREAQRTSPSIIYMPHIRTWWDATGETTRATFLTLLQDLPPTVPVLVLATSDTTLRELPIELQVIFGSYYGEVITMRQPNEEERRAFFEDLVLVQAAKAPVKKKRAAEVALQVLEVAPPPEPRKLTQEEENTLQEKEERTLRELRLFLRDCLSRLATEKKFRVFAKPVDPEEVPDYGEVVKNPMDLSTMMNKINMHKYTKAREFLDDIDLITSNALEYNPDRHPEDRIIRNRACELKDMAYAIVQTEMDSEFEKLCEEIEDSRGRRGDSPAKTAPNFYRVLPKDMAAGRATALAQSVDNYPTRFSRRALGMESEQLSAAEEAMLYASCRPERAKPKPKKRRLKSRWSRGFVPKLNTKKKTTADDEKEDQDDEGEDSQKNDGVTKEDDKDDSSQDIVENGVQEGEENEDQAMEVDDKEKQSVQENCIGDKSDDKSAMLNNHCSDNESVKSGEVIPTTRSTRRSGERSSRGSRSSEPTPQSANRSPAAAGTSGFSPAAAGQQTPATGRRSRGSSPRVLQPAASGPFQVNHVDETESEKTDVVNTNENSNSVSEDAPTSSLDPPSSVDNDTVQENKDQEEADMETEEAGGDNNGENQDEEEVKKDSPIQKRMVTRRMSEHKEALRAREILEASLPKLVVDIKRLQALLDNIVVKTDSFNIERLERLHASLSQYIYQHRRDYDKTQLMQDMEMEVSLVTDV